MRIIDADALTKKIQLLIRIHHRDIFDALNEIDNTPTIDPESLRAQGEWICGLDGSYMCSECGEVFRYEIGYYCSNCGVKMKGSENNA